MPNFRLLTSGMRPITAASGDPVRQRFLKEVIKIGDYVKESEDLEFSVTSAMLENWVTQFARMRENGVKVPIPLGHEGMGNADLNRGWVEDVFIQGESLMMVAELVGEDAIQAAQRCDVSIGSPASFTDGKGNVYPQPIEHVCLCTDPLIPGLGEFVPLAASRKAKKESAMNWDEIRKALGITGKMDDENATELILASVTELKANRDKEVGDLKASLSAATKSIPDPDPMLVNLAADNRSMKIDALVGEKITPATGKALKALFLGDDNSNLVLSLKGKAADTFDKVIEIFAAAEPIKKGEKTAAQADVLKDENKDNSTSPTESSLVQKAQARKKQFEAQRSGR